MVKRKQNEENTQKRSWWTTETFSQEKIYEHEPPGSRERRPPTVCVKKRIDEAAKFRNQM